MFFRSSNPALSQKVFANAQAYGTGETMTLQGTANKGFVLLFLLFVSASWVWGKLMQAVPMFGEELVARDTIASMKTIGIVGFFGGLIAYFVTIFKMQWAKFSAPVYAICQGLVLGGISAIYEMSYPGIVIKSVALTFGVLFCMLTAYRTGLVKVTDKMRMGVLAAVGSIFLIYMLDFVMRFFGGGLSIITSNSTFGIGFSLIVVGVAALVLLMDFDLIDRLAAQGAPRYMEWYGAFALLVTLIWLYLEILRLLSKLNSRR